MPRRVEPLTAVGVRGLLSKPGRYRDGKGLTLRVRDRAQPLWTLEYTAPDGRRRELSLGDAGEISLADARQAARMQRALLRQGKDPLAERHAERDAARRARARTLTFGECSARYIEAHRAGWRNAKHALQWQSTLSTYCEAFYALPVAQVGVPEVLGALEPIWTLKAETASRVRQRIEAVLDWAKARSYRTGENPARLRGHLDVLLPKSSKMKRTVPRAALDYRKMHGFIVKLRAQKGLAARALELQILCATRPGEAIRARWDEFDLAEGVWTIPPERMKAGVAHRVPLSGQACRLLGELPRVSDDFLFPGLRGKPMVTDSAMKVLRAIDENVSAHGFRSSFRDWAADQTAYPREVAEACLAHKLQGVEAAYRRTDFLEKRANLMQAWAKFCDTAPATGNVTAIQRKAKS